MKIISRRDALSPHRVAYVRENNSNVTLWYCDEEKDCWLSADLTGRDGYVLTSFGIFTPSGSRFFSDGKRREQ